jgi:hypothetical protein
MTEVSGWSGISWIAVICNYVKRENRPHVSKWINIPYIGLEVDNKLKPQPVK